MKTVNPLQYKNECIDIWNSYVESGEVVFKPIDPVAFDGLFLREGINHVYAGLADDSGLTGFGFANYADGAIVAYITYIGVKKEQRGKGVAEKILQSLEEQLKAQNPRLEKIELVFYNPCQLPWYIPGAAPHDHPGVPGVDMASAAYRFFAKAGYVDYAIQNTYYLPLKNYVYPDAIAEGIERLKASDIEIGYYDNDKHYGFSEFFDNFTFVL